MKKSRIGNFFTKFGFILNLGFALLLLLVYLSVLVPPDKFWPPAFLGLLFPVILTVNVMFLVYYAFRRSRKFLLSFAVIILGYQHLLNYFQPIPQGTAKSSGLKVLTYNVHYFTEDVTKKQLDNPRVLDYLKSANADIICLQECRIFKSGKLSPDGIRDALPSIRHYQVAHTMSKSGPLTLSRYPIARLGEIRFEHSANMVLFSDIVVRPGDTVRVYNCHFQSYKISPEDYTLTDPERSGTNEQQIREAKLIVRKMVLAFSIRARQARTVSSHISRCPYPVIVCGDFNDTPVSYTYHVVGLQLHDSFTDAGFGFSNTYHGILPSFRIDYILYSKELKATWYQCDRIGLSDHFPVMAVIRGL